jgi:hypothetical protein
VKDFFHSPFDRDRCRQELRAFRSLLDSKQELRENTDIKPFFEANRFLSAFPGPRGPFIASRAAAASPGSPGASP